jgi:uncharacterized protein
MTVVYANQQTVLAFYSAIEALDAERIRALLIEDASWAVMAKGFPAVSSDEGRERAIETVFGPVRSSLKVGSIAFTTRSIISSGDLVMVETVVRAEDVNGRAYHNQYAWAFELREGRISAIREYADTLHAARFFGVEVPAEG